MKVVPKRLILGLLLAAEGEPLSARDAIRACALFGISEGSVRVALLRLSTEGAIATVDRGLYELSGPAHQLADEVSLWRTSDQRVRRWSGSYIAVHEGTLRRSDREAVRRRDRALQMLGFRQLDPGLHVRPDNIEADVAAVRSRLFTLGLEAGAGVFVAQAFDDERAARIPTLWDCKALNRTYRVMGKQLEAWLERAPALAPDEAMRESFLLGSKAIREVVFDPFLPDPMVDTQARRAFIDTVRRFDQAGLAIWRQMRAIPSLGSIAGAVRAH